MKHYNIYLFMMLCCGMMQYQLYAQQTNNQVIVDSIFGVANQLDSDSTQVQYLHKTFFKYAYSKPEVSKILADTAIRKSQKIKDEYLLIRSLTRKGIYYDIIGKKDSALYLYDDAFVFAEKNEDLDAMASIYNNKGLISWRKEDYKEAMELYLNSYKIFKDLGQEKGQANSLNNIGLLLTKLKRYEESNDYHKKSLAIRKKLEDTYGIGASYTNLIVNFSSLKQRDSSIYYARKSIVTKKSINDQRGLAISYNNLAQEFKKTKRFDSAMYYFKLADNIYERFNAKRKRAENIQSLGVVYYDLGRYEDAVEAYSIAIDNLSKRQLHSRSKAYRRLANAFRELKDYKNASNYYQTVITLEDSIQRQNEKIATQEVFEKYQSIEKEKKILVQRAEIAEQNIAIERKNTTIFGVIALAFVLAVLGYLLYNQQKLKNKQLQKEHELEAALVKVETQNKLHEQRLKISRDLHDNIGSQLTFIISSIDNLKYSTKNADEGFINRLTNINFFTRNTINQLRDTIWAMNMDSISFDDLKTRMLNHIGQANALTTISIKFFNEVEEETTFSSLVGINIFRILQEAINNAVKHADTDEINIYLKDTKESYILHVQDSGKGFNVSEASEGNGMQNMQLRADEIHGNLQISSSEESGTQIQLKIAKALANIM